MPYDILIVDDDSDMLQMLSLVLGESGYGVRTASDGEEATKLAGEQVPDLVLLDLVLPMEDGIVVAERLKSGPCSQVPIIAMSAADPSLDRSRALNCFEGWLPKPFSLQTLLHFVALAEEKDGDA